MKWASNQILGNACINNNIFFKNVGWLKIDVMATTSLTTDEKLDFQQRVYKPSPDVFYKIFSLKAVYT